MADLVRDGLASVQDAQQRNNPNPTDRQALDELLDDGWDSIEAVLTELSYATFAVAWYTGYAAGFLVEAIVGTKATGKVLDAVTTHSKTAKRAADEAGGVKATVRGAAVGVTKRTAVSTARYVADAAPDLDAARVKDAIGDMSTIAQQRVAKRLVDDVDEPTRRAIADDGLEAEATTFLAGARASGARLLRDLDDDDRREFLRLGCHRGSSAGVGTLDRGCGSGTGDGTEPDVRRTVERAHADGQLSTADLEVVTRRAGEMADAGLGREFTRLLEETGGAGGQFAVDLSAADLARVLALERRAEIDDAAVHAFVRRTDDDGAALVSELDDARLERFFAVDGTDADQLRNGLTAAWRANDDVTDAHIDRAIGRYTELDAGEQRTFVQVSSDPDLQRSWTEAVGAETVEQLEVRRAVDRIERLEDDGHQLEQFLAADEIDLDPDTGDDYYTAWYDNPKMAQKEKSIVIEFETKTEMQLYRFWDSGTDGNRYGPWFTDGDDINRMIDDGATPSDVRDRYALPEGGKDRMSVLEVDSDTTMRMGTVGPWEDKGLDGGGLQYAIREPELKKETGDMLEEDFPGEFVDEDGYLIEEALTGELELMQVNPGVTHAVFG